VLANDSDPDFDALSLSIASQPPNGFVTVNNGGKVAASTITYMPNTGFSGEDSFTYALDDDDGGTDQATVTSGNAPPVVAQAIDNIELILGGDAFTNDLTMVFSDPDGDALTGGAARGGVRGGRVAQRRLRLPVADGPADALAHDAVAEVDEMTGLPFTEDVIVRGSCFGEPKNLSGLPACLLKIQRRRLKDDVYSMASSFSVSMSRRWSPLKGRRR